VAKAVGKGRTWTVNLESAYDWKNTQWTVPLNVSFTKVSHLGVLRASYLVGARYYFEAPEGGPEWGVRGAITLLFPRKSHAGR
jgi:hypothetical protein